MVKKLIVNLYGSPSAGKTVAATSIFSQLKKRGLDVVLVSEFAHEKVVEENKMALSYQLHIWSTQAYRLYCAYQHAQIVVTDSPILLGSIYNDKGSTALHTVILEEHHKYNNLNVVMELDPKYPYSMVGRIHNFDESLEIENRIFEMLSLNDIPFLRYVDTTEEDILALITEAVED